MSTPPEDPLAAAIHAQAEAMTLVLCHEGTIERLRAENERLKAEREELKQLARDAFVEGVSLGGHGHPQWAASVTRYRLFKEFT